MATAAPERTWPPAAAPGPGSAYGPTRAIAGCRCSPATRLTPDRRRKALALEPMTCPPNAFVTGDDLLVLQPGEEVTHTWGIQAFND